MTTSTDPKFATPNAPLFTLSSPSPLVVPSAANASSLLLYQASDLLLSLERNLQRRLNPGGPLAPDRAILPFPALNLALGGQLECGLHLLNGSPGAGKSAIALQTACEQACPVMYVTCEMAPETLFLRAAARLTKTPLWEFIAPAQPLISLMVKLRDAAQQLPGLRFLDGSRAVVSLADIEQALTDITPAGSTCLIVIDSIHSWADQQMGGSEYERLNAGIMGLQQLARTHDIPIVGICERNRASMASPGLSAGAGSRKLEYAPETVLSLQASETVDPMGWRTIDVKIEKNRWGAAGATFHLQFHGATQNFREVK